MKNLMNKFTKNVILPLAIGGMVFSGCERSPIIVQPMDINNDGYMDFYIKQPWASGVERNLCISNKIDGKVEYSIMKIQKNSDLYKKYIKD
ncbi:MAG TPA: hypothetical protein VJA20_02520 [Candidatus Nanoarchaeia archaeon]|nr:hypothetical protein [Candidatus Nanoarchaeia archaeon]